jgi:L-lactate dehydrogenase
VHAIALDKKQLLPVSSLQNGCYGLKDVCLSVPTIVGRRGAEKHIEIELWPKEKQGLQASARALKDMLKNVVNG